MGLVKLEYIWSDGYSTPNLRSKTKVHDMDEISISNVPEWSFDGSSTKQAEGGNSDCILKPVSIFADPTRDSESYLVICEVMNPDGSPHETNLRYKLIDIDGKYRNMEPWFGFEQEYTLMDQETGRPIGWPDNPDEKPKPQGEYYCGVGAENVRGRSFAEDHLDACLNAGIKISGINAEVMLGQWEYQIGPITAYEIDHVIASRYLLQRIGELYNIGVSLHPKPVKGKWNGSGCHINFSTKQTRNKNGIGDIKNICNALGQEHDDFITAYGEHNDTRLTGEYETSSIDEFSIGNSDRGCSVRIPLSTIKDGCGYFEDRRPASNVNPYLAGFKMISTAGKVLFD